MLSFIATMATVKTIEYFTLGASLGVSIYLTSRKVKR